MNKGKVFTIEELPESIDGLDIIQDVSIASEMLQSGHTIARYEFGDSMNPLLVSGQFCKLVPIQEGEEIKQGDCVLAKVNGYIGTHLVWIVSEANGEKYYCIATSQGQVLGWATTILAKAYGIDYYVQEDKRLNTIGVESISSGIDWDTLEETAAPTPTGICSAASTIANRASSPIQARYIETTTDFLTSQYAHARRENRRR